MSLLETLRRFAQRVAALHPVTPDEDDLDDFGAEDVRQAEDARRAADAQMDREAADHFDTLDYADGERDGRLD